MERDRKPPPGESGGCSGAQIQAGGSRQIRPRPSIFSEITSRRSFFFSAPATALRTVWFCQLVATAISAIVAPSEVRAQLLKRPFGVRQHAKHSTSHERTMAILEEYMSKPPTRKPSSDPHKVAEAVFKKQAPKAVAPAITPGARELVSLRIDQDVLARFQADGPGWQDRINDALRRASGLQGEGSSE